MIDQFLRFFFCKDSCIQITLDIDIQEGRNTSHTHGSAVLGLDGSQITKIQPLYCFLCISCRLRNVKTIQGSHFLHLLQGADLLGQFFPLADNIVTHGTIAAVVIVLLLHGNQKINAIESDTAVIPYDTSTAVSVRKSGDDLVMAGFLDFRRVGIKYPLIVGSMIFSKKFVKYRAGRIAVAGAGFLCHADPAERHESALQRFICLQSDNLLTVL